MGLRSRASRSTSAMSTRWSSSADVVGGDVVELAGEVQLHPVREVAAVRQGETEDGVARRQQRGHHGGVGLRARMRLHVGVVRAEQLGEAVDGELLGRRRRVRSRRSSAGLGSPRRTCWSAPNPAPASPRAARSSRSRSSPGCSAGATNSSAIARWTAGSSSASDCAENRVGGRRVGESCGVESHARLSDIPVDQYTNISTVG